MGVVPKIIDQRPVQGTAISAGCAEAAPCVSQAPLRRARDCVEPTMARTRGAAAGGRGHEVGYCSVAG